VFANRRRPIHWFQFGKQTLEMTNISLMVRAKAQEWMLGKIRRRARIARQWPAIPVFLLLSFFLVLSARSAHSAEVPASLPILTSTEQVHNLTYSEAVREYPVRLHNVQVLYYNPALGNLFVLGSGHGVYVDMRGQPVFSLEPGSTLDVDGLTGPGGYAPVVEHPTIRVLGWSALPPAPRYSLDHLLTGMEDCQWVEVEGIVRSVEESRRIAAYANQAASGGTTVLVTLATGAGRLNVIVREADRRDYHNLVDANVIVRGVSGPRFNDRRQLTGIHLFTQSLSQFQILQHGPADPFVLPIRGAATVMRYTPDVVPGHRIRVRGVVTANRNGHLISIADSSHGLFIRTNNALDLKVGDLIDVVGFPSMGEYTPVLEDVIYRKIGITSLPPPIVFTANDLFKGTADAELVEVRGRLLKQTRTLQEYTLLVSADDRTFAAVLPADEVRDLSSLRDGSTLELTGTCFVEVFPDKTPRGVMILLRSAADVRILHGPPWWTAGRAIVMLGLLLAVVLGALGWIALLRRRVRMQTDALKQARDEAAAINDLARAMQEVATKREFTARVSAAGSDEIAQLGIGFNKMLSELEEGELAKKEAEARLQQQAVTDELTGLPNRRLFSDRLAQSMAIAQRERRVLALLYVDLDGFKLVNDSLGHTAGDLLLVQVAQRLRSRIRKADTLARIGGDEFTVVLTTLRTPEEADLVARDILESLSQQFLIEDHEIGIGASIGFSVFPHDAADPVSLLQQADSAMYSAKHSGKNQVKSFTRELGSFARERLTVENQLRGAIAREEIHLHYQPEFDVLSHRLVRFEALARWVHPTLGTIPPAKFIPIAEESGLIVTLGAYLLEHACREAIKWQDIAPYPIQVAVNVSSLQFARPAFVEEVADTLKRVGLKPELLQIELTESIMLSGAERAAETMKQLRALGVSLAIDDFGTGYSCLSYLPRLPFNTLKIDRSFVHEMESRAGAKAIVRSLVTLAHSLEMQVIVEGIETVQQLQVVEKLGGNEVQGFLLGRPTPDPASQLHAQKELLKFNNDAKKLQDARSGQGPDDNRNADDSETLQ
jgi:diguanylate cyclase (GGDEF)-like protein